MKKTKEAQNQSTLSEGAQKFLEIKTLFERLSHEMFGVVETYHLWRVLVFAKSTTEAGEVKAHRNVAIMNDHKYFFIPAEDAALRAFVIGLMKFFDRDNRALSINRLAKELGENKKILTPEVILEVYPDRFHKEDISTSYAPLSDDDIKEIKKMVETHEGTIEKLKRIRDKQVVHADVEKFTGSFVPNDVENLIGTVQEVFNKLSQRFDLSTTQWDHIGREIESDTDLLLENLIRGEAERIAQIKREFS